jgi:excisionase family DNA binding protein
MENIERVLYSAEQVAEILGLHVRTVRNYVRDGRLKAVRIGKQYRIAKEDLEALTGRPADPEPGSAAARNVEVTSIVQIDAVGPAAADRLSTYLVSGAKAPRDTPGALRIQTVHDRERARMKIVILGGAAATADVLHTIDAILGTENMMFVTGGPDA